MRRPILLVALLGLTISSLAWAQYGYYRFAVSPNLKYDGRWTFTRLRYHSSSSWNHDYPRADRHLAYIVADISTAAVHTDGSNVLDLDDPEIFHYPLVYMLLLVAPSDRPASFEHRRLPLGGCPIEHEHKTRVMFGNQPGGPEEQPGQVRRDPPARIAKRCAVAQPDEREKLIQLAIAVYGDASIPEMFQRNRLVLDDRRQYDPHANDGSRHQS